MAPLTSLLVQPPSSLFPAQPVSSRRCVSFDSSSWSLRSLNQLSERSVFTRGIAPASRWRTQCPTWRLLASSSQQQQQQEEEQAAATKGVAESKAEEVEVREANGSAAQAVEGGGEGGEDVGEVDKILGCRVVDGSMQYLIQWKDEHPDSWEPKENIDPGIVEDYSGPWWTAARKGDEKALRELLANGRDPNMVDPNGRTAIFFAAGFGFESCVKLLLDAGSDLLWQDGEGYTPLHMAAGYGQLPCVRLLLEKGADPEVEDDKGRTCLVLAKELLDKTPQNPLTFARRLGFSEIVKLLDEAVFEEVEVEQVLDRRIGAGGVIEYLVKWNDDSEDSWEPATNIGEDLIRDYEEGLEYGVAEKILEKRVGEEGGRVEYLVKWADSEENTWEPAENVAVEVVAEFEGVSVEEMEERLKVAA